jgi:hypothetical protein
LECNSKEYFKDAKEEDGRIEERGVMPIGGNGNIINIYNVF